MIARTPASTETLLRELQAARVGAGLSQDEVATRADLSRMTVQRTESGAIDPRLSTLFVLARALGLELMLVPMGLRPELEDFIRSGGKAFGRPVGVDAPPSVIDSLRAEPPARRR
jgi:transcriptional regulator with XRE-family HTH domain